MLFLAEDKYELDLSRSWMVGDSEKDIEAGRSAGCRTLRVCEPLTETMAEFRVDHMDEVAAVLLEELESCVS